MNVIRQTAAKRYDEAIAGLQRMRDALDLLPDALLETPGAYLYSTSDRLRIDIPMTPTAFRDARRLLGRDWKREGHEWQDTSTGDQVFSLIHKANAVSLLVVLNASDKFATCERRQIGTKEVPIYETICHVAGGGP